MVYRRILGPTAGLLLQSTVALAQDAKPTESVEKHPCPQIEEVREETRQAAKPAQEGLYPPGELDEEKFEIVRIRIDDQLYHMEGSMFYPVIRQHIKDSI